VFGQTVPPATYNTNNSNNSNNNNNNSNNDGNVRKLSVHSNNSDGGYNSGVIRHTSRL
jgi:hypothetical protein